MPFASSLFDPLVGAAPVQQRSGAGVAAHRPDLADDDGVGAALDDVLNRTVDAGERVVEQRRAGRQRDPVCPGKPRFAPQAAASSEALGEVFVAGGEDADREYAVGA